MIGHILNAMRAQASLIQNNRASVRLGIVSSYDPENHCAKVSIQPEDIESGWLPVTSPWVGNGWGLFAPPTPGDMVEVQFQEDSFEAGFVVGRFFNDSDRPLAAASGEFWLVHQSGSFLKFNNDGTVDITAQTAINSIAPEWNHTGQVNIVGNVSIDGTTLITEQLTAQGGMAVSGGTGASAQITGTLTTTVDVVANGISLHGHTHSDPQGGSVGAPL